MYGFQSVLCTFTITYTLRFSLEILFKVAICRERNSLTQNGIYRRGDPWSWQ